MTDTNNNCNFDLLTQDNVEDELEKLKLIENDYYSDDDDRVNWINNRYYSIIYAIFFVSMSDFHFK